MQFKCTILHQIHHQIPLGNCNTLETCYIHAPFIMNFQNLSESDHLDTNTLTALVQKVEKAANSSHIHVPRDCGTIWCEIHSEKVKDSGCILK